MEEIKNTPFEEWEDRINSNISSRNESWSFYKIVEMALPEEYKLMLLMHCVYTKMDIMPRGFSGYFKKLVLNESEDSKLARKKENLKAIDSIKHSEGTELLDEEGLITIYRGIHNADNNIGGIFAANKGIKQGISYSFNPVVAQWFAIRTKSSDCSVISAKIHVDDIMSIYLDRQESEVMIIPPMYGGKLVDIKVEKIIPDISIMKQFDKLRAS